MKKLVVYYSIGGNTRAIAKKVAQALKADIAEIRTAKTYPDDHDVLVSLGKKEVESGYIPQILPLSVNVDAYDTIIIGTPVWWYSFAPAVKTFLSRQKWKGKKVYPFATFGGWLGHTPSDVRKAMRGAEVAPVLSVKFEVATQLTPDSEIKEWIAQIN